MGFVVSFFYVDDVIASPAPFSMALTCHHSTVRHHVLIVIFEDYFENENLLTCGTAVFVRTPVPIGTRPTGVG